ncbi:hybrid sensor histidine kinase/response regulator [uncultured Paraglaciecola sp.]|uniref:hybrid sensor histidine kinase/response regulator n=1 Tax=uncultured Paraglaciecola sp. TaxID=1765024 RepID=UPI0026183788|nr:hybrid sensor histidine kinase/response regulator [uncultured Paraglaciecola sp.]
MLRNLSQYFTLILAYFTLSLGSVLASDYQVELLNENNGFASSIIFSIVQDKEGFLWFGTAYDGIMRYDGKRILRYQHDPNNNNSLAHNNAGNLTIDRNNNLWIGSWGGGLSKLEIETNTFHNYQNDRNNANSISATRVKDIFEDSRGNIWLGNASGGFNKFNPERQDFTRFGYKNGRINIESDETSHARIWDIVQTTPDTLWIGTHYGLNRFNTKTNKFKLFLPPKGLRHYEHSKVRQVLVSENDKLFLGTDEGVLLFDLSSQQFTTLNVEGLPSIGPIYSMIKTSFNHYWVTSNHGVYSFTLDNLSLKKVDLGVDDQCSQSLFQDNQGVIWLSCEGMGVYKIIKQDTFKLFSDPLVRTAHSLLPTVNDTLLIGTAEYGIHEWNPKTQQLKDFSRKTNKAAPPEVWAMQQTSRGDIWFMNYWGLFFVRKGEAIQHVQPPSTFTKKASFDRFKHLAIDKDDNVWVGTAFGLFVIRDKTAAFEFIPLSSSSKFHSSKPLYLDTSDRIWIGRANGLFVWNDHLKKAKQFELPKQQDVESLAPVVVYAIHQDSQKRIWISTPTGLYLLDENLSELNLFSDHFVATKNLKIQFIKEDNSGYLWLFTPLGVSRLNPNNGNIEHFNKTDGLSDTRYFTFDVAETSDGSIYFSSRDGIHYFDPSAIKGRDLTAKTILTHFEVLGGPEQSQIFNHKNKHINLEHDQNYLRFEFATLDMRFARQIHYEYKLEGLDHDWLKNGTSNSIVYTNLSGGEYVFKVRASIKDGVYYEDEVAVSLFIATPIWLQWRMFAIYAGLIMLIILFYLRQQKKSVLKLEQQVSEKTASIALKSSKLEAANKVKSQFLANMSHEIRTPLTTVIGQAEAIICREIDSADIYKEVAVIHDSGLHLLELLNDVLDLTKIEENKFEVKLHAQDMHELLENIDRMFSIQAKRKGLIFTFTKHLPSPFIVNIDSLRVKQILINLCSNAVKFTHEGYIALDVLLYDNLLVFTITDTGIGMTAKQSQQIFESFTQGDADISRRFGGTGLGLSLSMGLAQLMKGTITVDSRFQEGSTFTFSIPVDIVYSPNTSNTKIAELETSPPEQLYSGSILLAEDHPENRRLIARLLSKLGLTVYTATDGSEAVDLYFKHQPQVILMDIQMPNVDGIQAFKILRKKGCQQPIIALTANAMSHEIEQYLHLGFNDHLSKPLNRNNLIATIEKYFTSQEPSAIDKAERTLKNTDLSDLKVQFKDNLAEEKQQLILHFKDNDRQSIAKQAHRLIGAAQVFGFQKLANLAIELETAIKHKNLQSIDLLIQNLLDEISHLTS